MFVIVSYIRYFTQRNAKVRVTNAFMQGQLIGTLLNVNVIVSFVKIMQVL